MINAGDRFYDGNSEGVVLTAVKTEGERVYYTWDSERISFMLITAWIKNNKLNKED